MVKPVLFPHQMAAIDAKAIESVPIEALIERAGMALAIKAINLMNGCYGKKVKILSGKGHNGDDGRVAGGILASRGASVEILDAHQGIKSIYGCDLVIDAAFGTGLKAGFDAPKVDSKIPVLAADIASGVQGDLGIVPKGAIKATSTVTFGALKLGLLINQGPQFSGEVEVAPIGLNIEKADIYLVEDKDLQQHLPKRSRDSHKWKTSTLIIAGSPGFSGAALLASKAAMRAGAGMVRLGIPGADLAQVDFGEAVGLTLPKQNWHLEAEKVLSRFKSIVLGPGLGTSVETEKAIEYLVANSQVGLVLDADALNVLKTKQHLAELIRHRNKNPNAHKVVITPHEAEFARLFGEQVGPNRVEQAIELARFCSAVVLLKGSTTVVANDKGNVLLVNTGNSRLATAGTGDVLSGIIGAFIARGLDTFEAAAFAAHAHGAASRLGFEEGLIASDLFELLAQYLSSLPNLDTDCVVQYS